MRTRLLFMAALLGGLPASAQPGQPLYEVTIVARTTKAMNYGYLSAPTRIGFAGTPLAPSAAGSGSVEPSRGATLLHLRFERLPAPARFGAQYLTYVVWSVSPEGRAHNLGELVLDGATSAKLNTSTHLQTFALIVTAEPYFAVSQPGDVVVLENVIMPDTIGSAREVQATYELLPCKRYTHDLSAAGREPARAPVSPEQYESIAALYQALNAIQIAQSEGADRYAPERMARARALYEQARGFPVHLSKRIVSMAREAAQMAEDSRAIAVRRAQMERAAAREAGSAAPEPRQQEAVPPPQTRAPEPERSPPAPPPAEDAPKAPVSVDPGQFLRDPPEASGTRRRLLAQLPRRFEILDSSRGIVLTLPTADALSGAADPYFADVAAAIREIAGLRVHVEGHSDAADSQAETLGHAEAVKRRLAAAGVPGERIVAEGFGAARPRTANATSSGRLENRRIEIVLTGDAIGLLPAWDRTYSLRPR